MQQRLVKPKSLAEHYALNPVRMDNALSKLIEDSVAKTQINPAQMDDVIVGCALQFDEKLDFWWEVRNPLSDRRSSRCK